MTWWLGELIIYCAIAVPVGILRWPGVQIAPPYQLPLWKRLVECALTGLTWLPQAMLLLWDELR